MSIACQVGETSRSRFLRVGEPTSVVRERPLPNGSESGDPELQGMRSDSKTHGEGQALALREGEAFFHRSAGACPPRLSGRPKHGEGQALALREGEAFFSS